MESSGRLRVAIAAAIAREPGLKQRDLAAAMGLSSGDLSRYVAGTIPRAETAVRIARALNTTVEAIWGAEQDAEVAAA